MSDEARTLLIEASEDRNGTILYLQRLNGTDIQTNGKDIIPSNNRRTIALWEEALKQIERNKLVVSRGYKNEVYEVTSKGYALADHLRNGAEGAK